MRVRCPGTRRRAGRGPASGDRLRVDRRTKNLTKRLQPGDIAVIDHMDIDRVSAEALVACRPAAVVNAAASIPAATRTSARRSSSPPASRWSTTCGSGRDGRRRRGRPGRAWTAARSTSATRWSPTGAVQTPATVAAAMEEARAGLAVQLESFAANTMEYLRRERELLLDGVGVPDVRTELEGRQVLIVVRGYHYKEDLATLRPYIREYRPVLIGVDGGADAILEAGYTPDMIVGDMDSVSDAALDLRRRDRRARLPGRPGPRAGAGRERSASSPVVFPATGTSEDVAMLLADDKGAALIVAVGTHATLVEFLDKGRSGMASTFLTRLRVGGKLVDAKGVSRLYRQRITQPAAGGAGPGRAVRAGGGAGRDPGRADRLLAVRRPAGRHRLLAASLVMDAKPEALIGLSGRVLGA